MSQSTKSNQRSYSRQSKSKMSSKTIQLNPIHVGATIGPKGVTILGLARSAGKGCRIQHQRENPGTFVITAWDSATVLRAEIKLREHIKQLDKKPKSKKVSQPVTKTGSRFDALASSSQKPDQPSQPIKLESGFRLSGTIRDRKNRKTQEWFQNRATPEQKQEFLSRLRDSKAWLRKLQQPQSSESVEQPVPSPEEFPCLGSSRPTLDTSIWNQLPEEVKTQKAKTPPPTPPSSLKTLKKGENYSEPEQLDFAPIKRVLQEAPEGVEQGDETAFSDNDDDSVSEEDREEWEDWDDELEVSEWGDEEW